LDLSDKEQKLPFAGTEREQKNSKMNIMETIEKKESERCSCTSMMRREAEAEPSNEDVAEPDQVVSGTAGTGQENEELEWARRHGETAPELANRTTGLHDDKPDDHPVIQSAPKLVERKTGLRGQGIDPVRKPKRSVRSRTEWDILAYDSDLSYAAVEKANRNLVCSLIERQDRVTERLLLMINDLQYRVDDLELAVEEHTKKPIVQKKEVSE
jgi:hypothetical protein